MAGKMTGEGRKMDILRFMHVNWMTNNQRITVGDYARFRGLSKSPYLREIFIKLVDTGAVEVIQTEYKATVAFEFTLIYENVESVFPGFKQSVLDMGWQEKLL